jgi:hypothetical protein
MTLTAEERRAINQRNSERSTGPRSAAGKARASQNALTHGLRAAAGALPDEDAEELKALADEWVDYYRPDSPGRRALLDRAVLATLQLRRCARFQAATLAKHVREAEGRWDQQQEEEVEGYKALLKDDPAAAVRGLRRSAPGCRWLIERWEGLKSGLERDGCWSAHADCDEALRLLGQEPDPFGTDHDVFWFHFVNLAAHPDPPEGRLAWFLDHQPVHATCGRRLVACDPTDREASVRELRALVAGQLEELRGREERLRREIEGPGRAEAGDRALLLMGPEGALWLRYERMHDAMFHRAYKALLAGEEESEATSAHATPPGADESPRAPATDERPGPCGTPEPVGVPADVSLPSPFEVGPERSEGPTATPAETGASAAPAPKEATEGPKSEAAGGGSEVPSGFGTSAGPDVVAVDAPDSAPPPGSEVGDSLASGLLIASGYAPGPWPRSRCAPRWEKSGATGGSGLIGRSWGGPRVDAGPAPRDPLQ